jgi:Fe2+ transport system protein FeoA
LTIHAATLSSRKWADRAPAGWLLARAFIGEGRASASWSDDELIAASTRDFAVTLGLRGTPVLTRVARYRHAMPHYTVGHLDRVAAASVALAETPQVVLAGGAYRGVGLPDCIAQGRAAAARLAQRLGGTADPNGPEPPAGGDASETTLRELPVGTVASVAAIAPKHVRELAVEGVGPGTEVAVLGRAPLGGPLVVRAGRARIAVPRGISEGVTVRTSSEPPA